MGRFIVKLEDYYLEWSTIVDAPVTFGMSLEQFKEYYQGEYGRSSMVDLERRLERAEKFGTSSLNDSRTDELIAGNRAGPNETSLTVEEIVKAYCLREPIRNGWLVPTYEYNQ